MSPEAFAVFARPFPEPHLLVSPEGALLAANPAALHLLDLADAIPEGATLAACVEAPREDVQRFLARARTSGSPLPATFTLTGTRLDGDDDRRYRFEAAGLRESGEASSHQIVVRLRPHASVAERFSLLNRQVERLAREIRERRRAEAALQEQAVELEAVNVELERAVEELRRRTVEIRQAREEAERASRAKSEFLAVVSHELRTPLNAILGYTDLLDAGVGGDLNAEQLRQLRRVQQSARHLLELIEEILTFARLNAGTERVRRESVDLTDLVAEVVDMVRPAAREKALSLRVEAPQEALEVRTDPRKLVQILLNLLSNAVKFTSEGEVGIRIGDGGEDVILDVFDTGPGVPPQVRERIFEPFEQGEAFTTRAAGGTGLGLAVSRELARLLEGDLVLLETPGDVSGSIFRLSLPLEATRSSGS